MKFGLQHFYSPTPAKIRKIGDTLASVSLVIAGYSITAGVQWIAITGLICAVLSKIITGMFTDEPTNADMKLPDPKPNDDGGVQPPVIK
jgi:hypothetical protein